MTLDTETGETTWYPTKANCFTESSTYQYCLYSAHFTVVDTGNPPAVGGNQPVPVPKQDRSYIPLDFIFEIANGRAPYFTHPFHELHIPDVTQYVIEFQVENTKTFFVCARMDDDESLPYHDGNDYVYNDDVFKIKGRVPAALEAGEDAKLRIENPSDPLSGVAIVQYIDIKADGTYEPKSANDRVLQNPACLTQSWRPEYGAVDSFVSFTAQDKRGFQSYGLYSILLKIDTDIIYVTGIIRDFHNKENGVKRHHDFDFDPTSGGIDVSSPVNSGGNGGETTTGFVSRFLGVDTKPQFRAGATATSTRNAVTSRVRDGMDPLALQNINPTVSNCNNDDCTAANIGGFYDWYNTDEGAFQNGIVNDDLVNRPRVYSVALARLDPDIPIYTYFSDRDFFPIDNELFGNEGDPHNWFFTWEIKTFLTYTTGDVLTFSSIDDMWVFIDGKLPVGWTLGGIPPTVTSQQQMKQVTIDLQAQFDLNLENNQTYRADIYWAHRSRRNPGVRIDLPDFSICDALQSGQVVVEVPASGFVPAENPNLFFSFGSPLDDSNYDATVTPTGFANTINALHLLQSSSTTTLTSSVWYHECTKTDGISCDNVASNDRKPSLVKLLNGFELKFGFIIKCLDGGTAQCAEGFAVVIHKNDNSYLGGYSGQNLGYGQTRRVLAIEFDAKKSPGIDVSDYGFAGGEWGEVSFHTRWKEGSSYPVVYPFEDSLNSLGANTNVNQTSGLPNMNFANGTNHEVRISYQTGQKDESGSNQPGYLRVYMNQNLAPVSETPIPSKDIVGLFGSQAFIGFTAANSESTKADVYITEFQLTLVTTSAQFTRPIGLAEDIIAGNTGCVIVQAYDTCDKEILVGGEAEKFRARYTKLSCVTDEVTDVKYRVNGQTVYGESPEQDPANPDYGYFPEDISLTEDSGRYRFCYNPTTSGIWKLDITFDGIKINKGDDIFFNVNPAPTDPKNSRLRVPLIGMPWVYNMADGNGVFVQAFNGHGTLLQLDENEPTHTFTSANEVNSYLQRMELTDSRSSYGTDTPLWAEAKADLVVFAASQTTGFDPALIQPALPANCFSPDGIAQGQIPANFDSSSNAWVCIVEVNGANGGSWNTQSPLHGRYTPGQIGRDDNNEFRVFREGFDTRTSFTRQYVLAVESATAECGGYVRVGAFHKDNNPPYTYRMASNLLESGAVPNIVTIEGVDAYKNSGSNYLWNFVFSPDQLIRNADDLYFCGDGQCDSGLIPNSDVDGLETCVTCQADCELCASDSNGNGLAIRGFAGNRAGVSIAMNIALEGNQDVLGSENGISGVLSNNAQSPFDISIDPGPACLETTTASGFGANELFAGSTTNNEINIRLRDCVGNLITRPRDSDIITVQMVSRGSGCDSASVACPVIDLDIQWTTPCVQLPCDLTVAPVVELATIRGEIRSWDLVITIDNILGVQTGAKATPLVKPNQWSPAASGSLLQGLEADRCQFDDGTEKFVYSGKPFQCIVQSRDEYGNDRWTANDQQPTPPLGNGNAGYVGTPSGKAISGSVVFAYSGFDGKYYIQFTPNAVSTAFNDYLNVDISQGGVGGEAVATFRFLVLPGEPDPDQSQLLDYDGTANPPPLLSSGYDIPTSLEFCADNSCKVSILSKDVNGNVRRNLPWHPPVLTPTDHDLIVASLTPAVSFAFIDPVVNDANGLLIYGMRQQNPAQFYSLDAKVIPDSGVESLTQGPYDTIPTAVVRFLPSAAFGPYGFILGDGSRGCVAGQSTSFTFKPADYFRNQLISYDNINDFDVVIVSGGGALGTAATSISEGAAAGVGAALFDVEVEYVVTYTCPTQGGEYQIYLTMAEGQFTNSQDCGGSCPPGCAGPTYAACDFSPTSGDTVNNYFRVLDALSQEGTSTSYAQLENYKSRSNLDLLRVGETTDTQAEDFWIIRDYEVVGQNLEQLPANAAHDLGSAFYAIVLTNVDTGEIIEIPRNLITQSAIDTGKYLVKWTPEVSGTFTAQLKYLGIFNTKDAQGSDVTYGPFRIDIGEVDPENSVVFEDSVVDGIDTLPEIVAGGNVVFTVSLFDVSGNVHPYQYCPLRCDTIACDSFSPKTECDNVAVTVTSDLNQNDELTVAACDQSAANVYQCTVGPLEGAGRYLVAVTTHLPSNLLVQGSLLALMVVPGAPDPQESYLELSSAQLYAGVVTEMRLILLDSYGNPAIVPSDFGTNVLGFTVRTGTFEEIVVTEIASYPSSITSYALLQVTPKLIDINTRTFAGGSWSDGYNQLEVLFTGTKVVGQEATSTPLGLNEYYQLYIRPGEVCTLESANCVAQISALQCAPDAVAGEELVFTVTLYDTEGNPGPANLGTLDMSLNQFQPNSQQPPVLQFSASETSPGVYTLSISGQNTQNVNYRDPATNNIVSFDFEFMVETSYFVAGGQTASNVFTQGCAISAGDLDVERSNIVASVSGVISLTFPPKSPDEDADYVLLPADRFGNSLTAPAAGSVSIEFEAPADFEGPLVCFEDTGLATITTDRTSDFTFTSALSWDVANSQYTFTTRTTVAGIYTLGLTYNNGQALTASCPVRSQWVQTICSGAPDPARSFFEVAGGEFVTDTINNVPNTKAYQVVAGSEWEVVALLRDFWDNPVIVRPNCPTQSVPVRVDNPEIVGPVDSNYAFPDNWVREVPPSPECLTLYTEGCNYVQSIELGETTNTGETPFTINVTEARTYLLRPAIDDNGWSMLAYDASSPDSDWGQIVRVVAGEQVRLTTRDEDGNPFVDDVIATAGVPGSFVIFSSDWWLNAVTGAGSVPELDPSNCQDESCLAFSVTLDSSLADYGFRAQLEPYADRGEGTGGFAADCATNPTSCRFGAKARFTSSWHGVFSLTAVIQRPLVGDGAAVWAETVSRTILHATCNYEDDTTNYRCADLPLQRHLSTCQATYAECTDLGGEESSPPADLDRTWCGGSDYQDSTSDCPCPNTEQRTEQGICFGATITASLQDCPSGTVQCAGDRTQCRISQDLCPSPRACPPGFQVCSDGVSCGRESAQGLTCPASVTCPPGQVPCWDGHCRSSYYDCPTRVTCNNPAHVVCSDGSCQPSRSQCPDRYNCFEPNTFVCPDGSCRQNREDCPSRITCPIGKMMCESGSCVDEKEDCPDYVACTLDQVRCPSGDCVANLLFCPSQITCSPEQPVRCADGQCVNSIFNCPEELPVCPDFRCNDGYCVKDPALCPSSPSCPTSAPILCSDLSCAATVQSCTVVEGCPAEAPVQCPDNSCHTSILHCPTKIICDSQKPVKCADGQCAVAIEACGVPEPCSGNFIRCPGGECALSKSLCPTHLTCPYDTAPVKCLDNTCVATPEDCTRDATIESCQDGDVSCPQPAPGKPVCMPSLDNCPTNMICPLGQVRCMDSSCALTPDDCPPIVEYNDNYFPCPDGTWAEVGSGCGQAITCSTKEPYKCWDGTCRIAPDDCPEPVGCTGGFQCVNGACTTTPWDSECSPPGVANTCTEDEPVLCEDGECVADASSCSSKYECTLDCEYCPSWQPIRCRDNTCVSTSLYCKETICPSSLPFLCPDGGCVSQEALCLTPSGCPAGEINPFTGEQEPDLQRCLNGRCDDELGCRTVEFSCPPPCDEALLGPFTTCDDINQMLITCDGGFCSSDTDFCPSIEGCDIAGGTNFRCADGTCVVSSDACTTGAPDLPTNMCPEEAPIRCDDGFCSVSSIKCPPAIYDAGCSGSKPLQCADGSCVANSLSCPLVKPCGEDEMRCGDGSCLGGNEVRVTCRAFDSCPEGTSRCRNGLCAPTGTVCGNEDFFRDGGCLDPSQAKCENGLCLEVGQSCPATNPNGCQTPEASYKCPDGACVSDSSQCLQLNGCLSTQIRCPDGSCVAKDDYDANPSICPSDCGSGQVRCDNDVCKDSVSECATPNNCPYDMPIRCADGTCKKYAAGTTGVEPAETCQLIVACNSGSYLCGDGSCAPSSELCRSVICPNGQSICQKDWTCKTVEQCNDVSVSLCPPDNPVVCSNGECRENTAQCPGLLGGDDGLFPVCLGDTILCFTGTCETSQDCLQKKADTANPGDIDFNEPLEGLGLCPSSLFLCPNGFCVQDITRCGVVPACPPEHMRCNDGSCDGTGDDCKEINTGLEKCPSGSTRCEDGFCRATCFEYDGCGINPYPTESFATPYHCPGRMCARSASECGVSASASRRVLAQTEPDYCLDNCYAQIKALSQDISIFNTTRTAKTYVIAVDSSNAEVMSLQIPSGAVALTGITTSSYLTLNIRPVGESAMREGANVITRDRRNDATYNYPDVLSFAEGVLSPAFRCDVPISVRQPFPTNLTVRSKIDSQKYSPASTSVFTPDDLKWIEDVCLAQLKVLNDVAYWSCLFGNTEDRRLVCDTTVEDQCEEGIWSSGTVWPTQAEPPLGDQAWVATSSFDRCVQTVGVESGQTTRALVYAFITSPLKKYVPPVNEKDEDNNDFTISIIVMSVIFVVSLILYGLYRCSRYRKKYKEQKLEADKLQEEYNTVTSFGTDAGQLKSGEVIMSKNPLAQQISHLDAAVDKQELKMQQMEQQLRADETEIRQEALKNEEANLASMKAQLQKMKAQFEATQEQNRGGAAQLDEDAEAHYGAGGTEDRYGTDDYGQDDPYQNDDAWGDSGFQGRAPRRQEF